MVTFQDDNVEGFTNMILVLVMMLVMLLWMTVVIVMFEYYNVEGVTMVMVGF